MTTTVRLNNYLIPLAKVTLQEDRVSINTGKKLRSFKVECSLPPKEYEVFQKVIETFPLHFSVENCSSSPNMNILYLEKTRSFDRDEVFEIESVNLEFEALEDERIPFDVRHIEDLTKDIYITMNKIRGF